MNQRNIKSRFSTCVTSHCAYFCKQRKIWQSHARRTNVITSASHHTNGAETFFSGNNLCLYLVINAVSLQMGYRLFLYCAIDRPCCHPDPFKPLIILSEERFSLYLLFLAIFIAWLDGLLLGWFRLLSSCRATGRSNLSPLLRNDSVSDGLTRNSEQTIK